MMYLLQLFNLRNCDIMYAHSNTSIMSYTWNKTFALIDCHPIGDGRERSRVRSMTCTHNYFTPQDKLRSYSKTHLMNMHRMCCSLECAYSIHCVNPRKILPQYVPHNIHTKQTETSPVLFFSAILRIMLLSKNTEARWQMALHTLCWSHVAICSQRTGKHSLTWRSRLWVDAVTHIFIWYSLCWMADQMDNRCSTQSTSTPSCITHSKCMQFRTGCRQPRGFDGVQMMCLCLCASNWPSP